MNKSAKKNHVPRWGRSKLFAFLAFLLCVLILVSHGVTAHAGAFDNDDEAIAITVIIPPAQSPPPPPRMRVFPVNVAEGYNYEGVREIVRVYELKAGETPDLINMESFERNGYFFQVADVVRRFDVNHTIREHTEEIEIQTDTNDLAAVISRLDTSIEFTAEDGYTGLLHLDITSIEMTQDGTRSVSSTARQVREFPFLSNPDMSLIPQTVTAGGVTYTLANVQWRSATAAPIDYASVGSTFTAVATYTRTARSSISTGYTTRVLYSGTLTRVSTGQTRYVVNFLGTPIVPSPALPEVPEEPYDEYYDYADYEPEELDENGESEYVAVVTESVPPHPPQVEEKPVAIEAYTIITRAGIAVGWFILAIILLLVAILVIVLLVSGRSKQVLGAVMALSHTMGDKFKSITKRKHKDASEFDDE